MAGMISAVTGDQPSTRITSNKRKITVAKCPYQEVCCSVLSSRPPVKMANAIKLPSGSRVMSNGMFAIGQIPVQMPAIKPIYNQR